MTLVAAPLALAAAFGIVTFLGSGAATGAAPSEPVDGAELFATQCSSCHGLDGLGVEGRGPTLEPEGEASADFVLRTGRMPMATTDRQAHRGPVRYSEEEIVALVEHVGMIGSGPDTPNIEIEGADVSNGGELYRLNCAACHVASGAGAPIGGGRQAPNLLEATPTEVGQAIIVGPGSMPVFSEFEPQELNDIAAYIHEALTDDDTTSASRFGGAGPVAEGLAAWILALIPLVALTRWIGRPKDGRDHPEDAAGPDGDDGEPSIDDGTEDSELVST
ncbi:cytochrome bc1 complex diheme cytochrome c subunit [Ilumatobacter nonamiensis]|uniref:cytochrome bc1 complex diheme cytochrome c subunit n=1 Tax=Ilumatobacter nonamiensis TaxID=467093 RepID=UPI00130D8B5C|nr:c-type cytochrome [Ilumatobacter nonamiensis]